MKRLLAVLLALLLVTMGITMVSAETITAVDTGFADSEYLNVGFSNGYHGFCMDYGLDGALVGDSFTPIPASRAQSNHSQPVDVSNLLKAIFTEGFHTLFQKDAAGTYVMTEETSQIAQRATWHFTDDYSNYWDTISPVIEAAKGAVEGGLTIPDNGYVKQVDDTTQVTFDFMVMETGKEGQQCFFAYNLTQQTLPAGDPDDPADPKDPADPDDPADPEDPVDPEEPQTPTDVPEIPTDTPNDGEDETPPSDGDNGGQETTTSTDTPDDPDDPLAGGDGDKKDPPIPPVDEGTSVPEVIVCPVDPLPESSVPEKAPVVSEEESPKTGDSNALAVGVCLAAMSAAVLVVCKKR